MKFGITAFIVGLFLMVVNASAKVAEVKTSHGVLFYPLDNQESHPGILLLHGSEGGAAGYSMMEAKALAEQGYTTIAHCYFGCEKSSDPQNVEFIDLPIDRTYEALIWLKNSEYTKGHKTALYGVSKGSELTLLIAALSAEAQIEGPDLIAAHAVTDAPEVGFSWNWSKQECWVPHSEDSSQYVWNTHCGVHPPAKDEAFKNEKGCYITPKKPLNNYTYQSWTWKGSHKLVATHEPIRIENFKGPTFFTHGMEDKLWCASKAVSLKDRLQAEGMTPEVHLFDGEGHVFSPSAEKRRSQLLLDFFNRHLKDEK